MAQRTLVLTVRGERADDLERRLSSGPFDFKGVPHARFSARGDGTTVTLYRSGKLVIQGPDPEGFVDAWLDDRARDEVPRGAPDSTSPGADETTVGSDESGKGDFFGPLVVAAVRLEPAEAEALSGGEVTDSKKLGDEQALRLGAALRERYPYAIEKLEPPEYNATHARVKNLNPMLAELHAKAIARLARPGMRVIVDQFAAARVLEQAIAAQPGGDQLRLFQRHRAEEITVVAAASILAREEFLLSLARLSDEFGVELRKGAGSPADQAARRFTAVHGSEALGRVAKVHFKNARKLAGGAS